MGKCAAILILNPECLDLICDDFWALPTTSNLLVLGHLFHAFSGSVSDYLETWGVVPIGPC